MYTWQCIQKSINYIEKHYNEQLDISQLASISNLSIFYYQRLFKKLVNKTVNEYIILRRLSYSIKLLQSTDKSILDIALECGFQSDSNFSKVFKKTYNTTPNYVRKNNLTLDVFAQPKIMLNYTNIDLGVPLITDNMFLEVNVRELSDKITFIGKETQSLTSEIAQPKINYLTDLWKELTINKDILSEKQSDHFYDILTPSNNPEYFNYFVGVLSNKEIDGFTNRTMPKGKYFICSYEAENFELLVNESLYVASKYFYEVYLPQHNINIEPFIVQKYSNPDSGIYSIEIWAKESEEKNI